MADATTDVTDLVDLAALRQALSAVVAPFADISVSLLSGGASNLTFLLTLGQEVYVLRRRPVGPSAARAHDMKREFTVISALNETDFPVPHAVFYSEDRSVVGEPFYVMRFVEGTALHTPDDAVPLDAAAARTCSEALVDTLAALHAVDPVQIGLKDFGWPHNFLERRITSWLRQWDSAEHRDFPEVQSLGRRLLAQIPGGGTTALVHGDYRLGNVLFALEPSMRLVAVLDWEMSTVGDPLTDLAHLLVYWEPTKGRVTHPSQVIAQRPGFLNGQGMADRYAELTGRDVGQLPYYMAFEHWRAAIIKDAIYLRARSVSQGGTLPDHVVSLGDSVQLHLEEAADVLADLRASTG
jgi:aminoglycoside phosphotransferase (APT) family kinase protein